MIRVGQSEKNSPGRISSAKNPLAPVRTTTIRSFFYYFDSEKFARRPGCPVPDTFTYAVRFDVDLRSRFVNTMKKRIGTNVERVSFAIRVDGRGRVDRTGRLKTGATVTRHVRGSERRVSRKFRPERAAVGDETTRRIICIVGGTVFRSVNRVRTETKLSD